MASVEIENVDIAGNYFLAMIIIVGASALGIGFAFVLSQSLKKIKVRAVAVNERNGSSTLHEGSSLVNEAQKMEGSSSESTTMKLIEIHDAISRGANSFLWAEYKICFLFIVCFGALVFVLVGSAGNCGEARSSFEFSKVDPTDSTINPDLLQERLSGSCWSEGLFTTIAFVAGGITSIFSGYIGMKIAVYTNVRTAVCAQSGWTESFNSAFRGGAVMGFSLCALALSVLFVLITIFYWYLVDSQNLETNIESAYVYRVLFECIAGYGLGGSCIAMFGRVGGGIYTKAADVGADLVGKVEKDIPEDDPRNPATIADNVGDNVGDIAGMGADLFGSFAESTCAALVLASLSKELQANFSSLMYPLLISAAGIVVCFFTSFVATDWSPVRKEEDVEKVLKYQLVISTVLLTPVIFVISFMFLPDEFCVSNVACTSQTMSTWKGAFMCVASGLWSGLLIGLVTEYYTSHSYSPVREVAQSTKTGAATVIIYGLALGYVSTIIPVAALGLTIFVSYKLAFMYGVALAALGMLSSLSIGLTIDAYGPITDNAGGIAEMAGLGSGVRHITDTLDAAGNTTAAIGKGFAIGSAALVSLALFGAFVARIGETHVDIMNPLVFAFLLFGSMLPYWFSAMTMKSVGVAAMEMVVEVRKQFAQIPGLMEGTAKPNYERCVDIATQASLRQMVAPALLVILAPLLTGYLFGVHALSGLLAGGLCSGVQMAISASNTGGAWDNAKKYIESGAYGGKGSDCHKAAVVGDTVGDPLKDTSGPALNILMKLMAILSLVFADFFVSHSLARSMKT
mmetsp:Transcript_368/g.453  ORF Transcript_368/g.453 Transcript_368/m.453 type:complete len:798 (+) Transcript_368:222-2615(+)